jgi:4-alpha-glucanotransferase
MMFPRSAGLLLHPTSFPGPGGIGDLGPEAHNVVEFMHAAGLKLWQVLPLGPTGYGDSPYQCLSAFAGNPMLVHVPECSGAEDPHAVAWGAVIPRKDAALRRATAALADDEAYRSFCRDHAWWLEDFALFMALKEAHGGVEWTRWEPAARDRDPAALVQWRTRLADDIEHHRRVQHLFFQQWGSLRAHCADRGIRVMGDLPIYVAHDSADVWAAPHYFKLRPDGRPDVQAGVPPDYFSATGQLWGNPIYHWDAMQADGFAWWIRRMRAMFAMVDTVRIDHFRGFAAYWEVPGDDTTAINGRWVNAPGDALFSAITAALGPLPILAENLGLITPDVEALRTKFGYPGMAILQFAFGADGSANDFQPHTYPRDRVVYTGTHDNDTVVGWWNSVPGADSTRTQGMIDAEKAFACRYLGTDGHDIHWTMIRAVLASVADTAIIPMQDLVGLGSEARMNLPGRASGNWGFRFTWDQVTPDIVRRLREMIDIYQR